MPKSIEKITEHGAISIIERAARLLKDKGEVDVRPLAHEMGVSNEEVPSLVFVSNKDKKRVFVVEFKHADAQVLPDIFLANANQYKLWLQENNPNVTIEYGLSSNGEVAKGEKRVLNVEPIASITSAEDLVERIDLWVDRTIVQTKGDSPLDAPT